MNTKAPLIGVFDSGIGGLSVLRALQEALPHARYTYLADNAWAPYGERDADALHARVRSLITHWHSAAKLDLLVVACNTATAIAVEGLRSDLPHLPVVGIEPALKPAFATSRSRSIGVLATRATLQSARYLRLRDDCLSSASTISLQECCADGLAGAIESDDHAATRSLLEAYIGALLRALPDMDTLVLGCTHYPLVRNMVQDVAGMHVALMDPAEAVARRAVHLLGNAVKAGTPSGAPQWQCTGSPAMLTAAARRWLRRDVAVSPGSFDPPTASLVRPVVP
ncbi:MAG: glutamate racemase [Hydrogenophaga sp.]|uniref:glutamate racemase n=1 Tax=Hydrogenophaga sp. TaxID=1904254 RepID=UPI001DC5CB95|nr:glutamate racemase [Hydrogenophaga sp.]MBX3610300.1 glutamate racemase [Hydrogenophaga sp.]